MGQDKESLTQLISIIQEALRQDEQLRQKYQIGDKFRFVRDRLQNLLENVQKEDIITENKIKKYQGIVVGEDEVLVYIHLYNAQGALVRTWQSMMTSKALFDYSVNRPIYLEKEYIQTLVNSKLNKVQHGYLTMVVKRNQILLSQDEGLKDTLGNPLVKIKEGALHFDRIVSFTHNEQEYVLGESGELFKILP